MLPREGVTWKTTDSLLESCSLFRKHARVLALLIQKNKTEEYPSMSQIMENNYWMSRRASNFCTK